MIHLSLASHLTELLTLLKHRRMHRVTLNKRTWQRYRSRNEYRQMPRFFNEENAAHPWINPSSTVRSILSRASRLDRVTKERRVAGSECNECFRPIHLAQAHRSRRPTLCARESSPVPKGEPTETADSFDEDESSFGCGVDWQPNRASVGRRTRVPSLRVRWRYSLSFSLFSISFSLSLFFPSSALRVSAVRLERDAHENIVLDVQITPPIVIAILFVGRDQCSRIRRWSVRMRRSDRGSWIVTKSEQVAVSRARGWSLPARCERSTRILAVDWPHSELTRWLDSASKCNFSECAVCAMSGSSSVTRKHLRESGR